MYTRFHVEQGALYGAILQMLTTPETRTTLIHLVFHGVLCSLEKTYIPQGLLGVLNFLTLSLAAIILSNTNPSVEIKRLSTTELQERF